ncbi:hypothetical protein EVAR_65450_1 [Eumeta japonica]|uniref:Uncharacterized protein n=1 Tax=Eumeta variegata TaxID=151549 RepID=A0A4C1ZFK3_EUMVA|nr:hypothetical protein EVAR_65450_1 [Eumeta japonica]
MYALVPDRSCLFPLSLKLHTVANQRDGKERNSPFCVISSLSAATVVSSTTARLYWFYTDHVVFTCNSQIILIIITTHDMMNDLRLCSRSMNRRQRVRVGKQNWIAGVREGFIATAFNLENTA